MSVTPAVSGKRPRSLERVVEGIAETDGAGVQLKRIIGQPALDSLDPFLLLDNFRSDCADDYIAGFPAHPHRGFETVTYLLAGRMRHTDNAGHEGVIEAGGVQWMTAGRGIVHSEMPQQENGLLEGFQLWVNLPASHKMDAPSYQEFSRDRIATENRENTLIKVIAGETALGTKGPVNQPLTEPLCLDVSLQAESKFAERLPPSHNAFLYVIHGKLEVGGGGKLARDQLGILSAGDRLELTTGAQDARFLLVAGKPLKEPIARGGPFVMNTKEEIQKAFADYKAGHFG